MPISIVILYLECNTGMGEEIIPVIRTGKSETVPLKYTQHVPLEDNLTVPHIVPVVDQVRKTFLSYIFRIVTTFGPITLE